MPRRRRMVNDKNIIFDKPRNNIKRHSGFPLRNLKITAYCNACFSAAGDFYRRALRAC